jgi:L-cysteine/cystine lyase
MTLVQQVETKLDALREQLPAVRATGYFNAGTNGPMSIAAHKAIVDAATEEFEAGRIIPGVYEGHAVNIERVRVQLSSLFGGEADEFALTRSSNEGLSIALNGIDWAPGDEVITTNLEHPLLFAPLGMIAHRYGIKIRVADIGNGGGDIIPTLERQITGRTRVIALSHVMWSSGAVIDLTAVAELAHAYDALLIVDAAQSAGQVPVNLPETNVDAYAMPGQKWLGCPEGTGALWIPRHRLTDFVPTYVRYCASDPAGYIVPCPGSRRYEMGEAYAPAVLGMEAQLQFLLDEVGPEWMYERTRTLADHFLASIEEIDGITVFSPRGQIGGLVCFNIAGATPQDVAAALFERNYTIRYVAYPPGPTVARASIAWWNSDEEVDGLVEELRRIARDPSSVEDKAVPA